MFCPKCRTEYSKGSYICADCDVELVHELPPRQQHEFTHFSRLHSPASSSELLMIKSILSRADINYYTTNDKYGPDIELHKGCMIMVQDGHVKKAKKVLTDYQIVIKPPRNSLQNKLSSFEHPRRTLKNFLFGWVTPGKKKDKL